MAPAPIGAPHGAAALRLALARGELAVHFQPIIRLRDGRPAMVEALVRWPGQAMPVKPPAALVALAEANGMSEALAIAVIARAVTELGRLRLHPRFGLTVNLPLGVLLRPWLPSLLRRLTRAGGLPRGALAIELTETTPVRDRGALRTALRRLRAAGHAVWLDDVVSGDPRAALLALPFAGVKLDRSLVAAMPHQAHARAEVRRLSATAARRGQAVVAEGLADRRGMVALRRHGIGFAQGYGIARPMPPEALPGWSVLWRAARRPGG